jgi:hypothetical protein
MPTTLGDKSVLRQIELSSYRLRSCDGCRTGSVLPFDREEVAVHALGGPCRGQVATRTLFTGESVQGPLPESGQELGAFVVQGPQPGVLLECGKCSQGG